MIRAGPSLRGRQLDVYAPWPGHERERPALSIEEPAPPRPSLAQRASCRRHMSCLGKEAPGATRQNYFFSWTCPADFDGHLVTVFYSRRGRSASLSGNPPKAGALSLC